MSVVAVLWTGLAAGAAIKVTLGVSVSVQLSVFGVGDQNRELRLGHFDEIPKVVFDLDLLRLGSAGVLEYFRARRATARPTKKDE